MTKFDHISSKDKANESFCGLCKKHLSSKLNFNSTKNKSFQCSDCDKAFLLKRYLYHHKINAHTDKRIRSCKLCPRKYKSDGHLRKHLSTAHGDTEKKFKCQELECDSSFVHQDYLDKREHKCEIC